MNNRSRSARSRDVLLSMVIPSIPENLENRLKNGGLICVDVGCSLGTAVRWMAEAFPKSQFFGFDIDVVAIDQAKLACTSTIMGKKYLRKTNNSTVKSILKGLGDQNFRVCGNFWHF